MKKLSIRAVGLLVPFLAHLTTAKIALGAGWSGVDESVVEHYAEKAGRSAWTPFINTDQGDLLLFVFLIAGVIGGFVVGYYWRILFKDGIQKSRTQKSEIKNQKSRSPEPEAE
ncbi:MAG: hypothetical protein K6T91_09615 [Firmicutes bacterium]|nr:hypothetical protein [Bacillota bacterium]